VIAVLRQLSNCSRIDDVILSVLAGSVVYLGVESLSGQTKDYNNGMCCFYAKHAALRDKTNTDWLGIPN
jgi:hypothetical protein